MTQITVDLTGITEGDTLSWDAAQNKFVVGPPLVASTAINAPGQTVAALPSAPADGARAIVHVGTWPNDHQEVLRYHAGSPGRWVGEAEYVLVTQGDSWAMDLGNRSGAQLLDWSDISNAVPYGKAFAIIAGPLNLSAANFDPGTATGVITVDDTTDSGFHSHAFQAVGNSGAYLQIRDNFLTYTGKTSTTFTGCAVVQGSRGTIPDTEMATQGYPGGWGFNNTAVLFAGDLFAAGLRLQERLVSLMNSAPGEKKLTIAPYWFQYDPGDGTMPKTIPPSGGMGESASLVSLAGTGGTQVHAERTFYMTSNGWTDWPLATPVKQFLVPRIVGKMESGATLTGSCLDTKLAVRWVV